MVKMYKKLLALVMAILMAVSMAACGAPAEEAPAATESPKAEAPAASGEKQKIIIWNNNTNENQLKALEAQMNELAAEMDFEFEMVAISFNEMYTKLATSIDAGEAPDIMNTNFAGCATLYESGMLTDLTDVIESIGKDKFVASYIRNLTTDGSIWAIPDWCMHTSVWYRKDLFAEKGLEIPTTWEVGRCRR